MQNASGYGQCRDTQNDATCVSAVEVTCVSASAGYGQTPREKAGKSVCTVKLVHPEHFIACVLIAHQNGMQIN